MNDTSVTQEHKRPVSKLAKISLVFSLAGFACALPGAYLDNLEFLNAAGMFLLPAFLFIVLGFIFGITALLAILIKRRAGFLVLVTSFFISFVTLAIFMPAMGRPTRPIQSCGYKCKHIRYDFMRYARDHNGKPPTPQNWCDALTSEGHINKVDLICPWVRRKSNNGLCNYAINPDCEPNSPNNVVFLFETKGGWNQYGGPELISFNNHVRKGANVLFNDGHVEFVKQEDASKLKWKVENVNSVK